MMDHHHLPHLAEDAHHLAGKPGSSWGKVAALTIGTATASNVAAYQINKNLAHNKDAIPLDPMTGGTPPVAGAATANVTRIANRKYTRSVRNVRNKYSKKSKGGK